VTLEKENPAYSLGVDIGGTKISIGIVSDSGAVVDVIELQTGPDYSFRTIGNNIIEAIRTLLTKNEVDLSRMTAVGFGIPGTTDSKEGVIAHAPNLGWIDVPFGEYMQDRLNSKLYFAQETHAAVLAEYLFGAGRGCENLACVAIGTGIGCGLILKGKLHRGSFNTAGEFGHIVVVKNGNLCACGRKGCLETYGSGASIKRFIESRNIPGTAGKPTEELFHMALQGNEELRNTIIELVEYIGMGLVSIVNLLSPEKILLTGGLADQDELVVQTLKKFVRENAYSIAADRVIVEKAALGKNTPMIGAAMLYKNIEPYTAMQNEKAVYG
jgi:glucokinase